MPDDVDSTRDVLTEVWDRLDAASPEAHAPPPAASSPAPVAEAAPAPETPSDGPVRDAQGRFTAKSEKPTESERPPVPPAKLDPAIKPAGEPSGAQAAGGPPAPAAEPVLKAPQSWTPEEREAFAKSPAAAQRAAIRREAEVQRVLNETAEPRKLREAVAPYEHLFKAAGVSAPQAVGNVLQKYAALHTAPLQVRSQILGQLIRDHLGTDEAAITMLAAALDSRGQPAPVQSGFSPEQMEAAIEKRFREREYAAKTDHALGLIKQFEATQPEHFEQVRADMGLALGAWERDNPGQQPTLDTFQQAYKKACGLNDRIREIEQLKEEAKRAATANAATQKAKASSVSVKSTPVGPAPKSEPGDDWRSHVAAAMEAQERQ